MKKRISVFPTGANWNIGHTALLPLTLLNVGLPLPHVAFGCWRIHCGVVVTKLSPNKQHSLSLADLGGGWEMGYGCHSDRGGPFGVAGLGERRRLAGTMCVICGGGYMRSLGERRRLAGTSSMCQPLQHMLTRTPSDAKSAKRPFLFLLKAA